MSLPLPLPNHLRRVLSAKPHFYFEISGVCPQSLQLSLLSVQCLIHPSHPHHLPHFQPPIASSFVASFYCELSTPNREQPCLHDQAPPSM